LASVPAFAAPSRSGAWLTAGAVLGVPAVVFAALWSVPDLDVHVGSPSQHFYLVTVIAMLALMMAVGVTVAARRLPDARTLFLSVGFFTLSLVFFAHGAGTSTWFKPAGGAPLDPFAVYANPALAQQAQPMDHATMHGGAAPSDDPVVARLRLVGFSSLFSLAASAPFFALAVMALPGVVSNFIVKRWWPLLFVMVAHGVVYVVVALAFPTWLNWLPVDAHWLVYPVGAFAAACFAFAGWRCLQAYRFAMLPLQGTMALAMGLLIEATVFLLEGNVGQLTWWCYHVVMLAGFSAATVAFLRQYRDTGDLGVVIEGLFLRDQISGIRQDDPKALTTLVAAVGAKDNETANHIERVSALSLTIGREAGVAPERLEVLRWAGRLHDVGKIGVPNSVLLKPGRLTPAEFETMKHHAERGWLIASRSPTLSGAARIIRAHHERYDGTGYPDGLKGEDIPLESRIISTADIWDALTGKRPYKDGMPPEQAASIMLKEMSGHLDPRLLEILFEIQGIRIAQLGNIA
jgi:hypothetical protein